METNNGSSAIQNRYGLTPKQWDSSKGELRMVLTDAARNNQPITYGSAAKAVTSVNLDANSYALFELLGEISCEEDAAGRGMLSAFVVRKDGDMEPGRGFFELAANTLGHNVKDRLSFWIGEMKKAHEAWK